MASLARLPEVRPVGPGCGAGVDWYRDTYSACLNLGVIDRQGLVVCSALPPRERVYVGDSLYFRQVIATRQFAVGEYQIGRTTQKAALNLGYRLFDTADPVRAVLYDALDLGRLSLINVSTVLPTETQRREAIFRHLAYRNGLNMHAASTVCGTVPAAQSDNELARAAERWLVDVERESRPAWPILPQIGSPRGRCTGRTAPSWACALVSS